MVTAARFAGLFEGGGVPPELLRAVGSMAVSISQRAFRDQAFDGVPWPGRYPNQSDPFINVAGMVADFRSGKTRLPARRFERRPALRDIGTLFNSLGFKVVDANTVEVGADKNIAPYADLHNAGGKTTQPVTETVRKALSKWLKSKQGRPHREKVGFLFRTDVLETQLVRRRFIGVTEALKRNVIELVQAWVESEGRIRRPEAFGGAA